MKALADQLSPVITDYLIANYQIDIAQFEYQATRKEFGEI